MSIPHLAAKQVGRNWHVIIKQNNEPVVAWIGGKDSPHAKEAAHLLAAAPELLEACELMADLPEENFHGCRVGEAIRAARKVVAKAMKGKR